MAYSDAYSDSYGTYEGAGGGGGGTVEAWRVQWSAALNNRANAPASWVSLGDSVTEGQGATSKANAWNSLTLAALRSAYPTAGVAGGLNFHPPRWYTYAPDSTWSQPATVTGTVTYDTTVGNLGYRVAVMSAGSSHTLTVTGTSVDIWYHTKSGGGSFTYQVDGGTASAAVATSGTAGVTRLQGVSLGTSGSHTVRINATGSVTYGGLTIYNGDETKGIRGFDSSHSSWTTALHLSDFATELAAIGQAGADLVTIYLGLNDTGPGVAAFQTNLTSIVSQLQGLPKVPSILIISSYCPSGFAPATWAQYRDAMQAVATARSTGFLDLAATMPQATTSGTGNYVTDGLHPNNTGHQTIANLVTPKLAPNPTVPSGTAAPTVAVVSAASGSTTRSGSTVPTVTVTAAAAGGRASAGSASSAITVTASATPLNYNFGVCIPAYSGKEGGILFASTAEMQSQINAAVAAGIGWFRTDVVMQQASYTATWDAYDWAAWDATFTYARSKGMKILACVQGQATVDGAAPSVPTTATSRSRVASFAASVATRYGPGTAYQIDAIEMYNEANTERFWPSPSMAQYGPVVAAIYPAVKAARPALPVVMGGTGGIGHVNDVNSLTWYQQLYAGGYHQYCDATALHTYSNFTTTPGQNEEAYIVPLRSLMNSNGDTAKPMWSTETGAPTGGSYGVSEATQATIIGNSWSYFRANAGAQGPLFLYTLEDFAVAGGSANAEDYFGIRRYDKSLKPAYSTVQALAAGATPVSGSAGATVAVTSSGSGARLSAGSTSSAVTVVGSASGTEPAGGIASAVVSVTTAAAGSTTRSGAGGALVGVTGSAAGSTATSGSAAATTATTSSATGGAPSGGAADSTVTVTSTASGQTVTSGSVAATVAVTSAASGQTIRAGSVVATVTVTSTATGGTAAGGQATATTTTTGSATGAAPVSGGAASTVSVTSVATGATATSGSAAAVASTSSAANGTAPVVGGLSGSAAATVAVTSAASGARLPAGTAAATVGFAGTADGVRASAGQVAQPVTVVSAATGTRVATGDSAAAVGVVGQSSGQADRQGSAVAAVTVAASASGSAPVVGAQQGSASATTSTTSAATGGRPSSGAAALVVGTSSAASGSTVRTGDGAGSVSVSGTVSGGTPTGGTAVSSVVITSGASGARQPGGTADLTVTVTSGASGGRGSAGTVVTQYVYAGTATGQAPTLAAKAGTALVGLAVNGSAVGSRPSAGAAAGAVVVRAGTVGEFRGSIEVRVRMPVPRITVRMRRQGT